MGSNGSERLQVFKYTSQLYIEPALELQGRFLPLNLQSYAPIPLIAQLSR